MAQWTHDFGSVLAPWRTSSSSTRPPLFARPRTARHLGLRSAPTPTWWQPPLSRWVGAMSTCSSSRRPGWRTRSTSPGATPRIASIGPREADLGPSSARRPTAACSERAVASSTQPPRRRSRPRPCPSIHTSATWTGWRALQRPRALTGVRRPRGDPPRRAAGRPGGVPPHRRRGAAHAHGPRRGAGGLASGHGAVAHPDGSFVDEAVVGQACSVMALAQQPT